MSNKTGVSERTIQHDIQIATKLKPEVKKEIREIELPKNEALRLVRAVPKVEDQLAVLQKIKEKKAKTHSAPYETLKGHLNLSSQALLSTAIKTLMEEYPGEYSKKVSETDARKNILIWHPESKRRLAGKIL